MADENNIKKPLSKIEQLKAAAAAQSSQNISQANIKETKIKVSLIKPNPFQPRRYFDEEKLKSEMFARVIEIAENDMKLPIRKKYDTK